MIRSVLLLAGCLLSCAVLGVPTISDLKVTPIAPLGVVPNSAVSGAAAADSDLQIANQDVNSALYCVVDLSGGASAKSYPVSYLSAVPTGGWRDEHKTTKLVLRRIEAGSFIMGKNQTTKSHSVTLTKPFYIGVFEITQNQWKLVMGSNPSYYKGDTRPVDRVSYNSIRGSSAGSKWPSSSAVDATSFLGKLRAKTGLNGFDLPTEAQWEYACRAGTTSEFNNGGDTEEDLKTLGRYWGNRLDGRGGYTGAHTAVGSYEPNAWGLYDMHGNVLEWCLDWRGSLSYGIDPVGSTFVDVRVVRGGSWDYDYESDFCTSSYRDDDDPSSADYGDESDYGFRLVCTLGTSDPDEGDEAGGEAASYGPFVPGVKVSVSIPELAGYTAKGLPSGLKFDKRTGTVSGAAKKPTAEEGVAVTFTKRGAKTRTARFIVGPLPTLSVEVGEGGTVTGAGSYAAGKKVTLKAKAAKGYVFAGWYEDDAFDTPLECGADFRSPSLPYVMPEEDVTVGALFAPVEEDAEMLLFVGDGWDLATEDASDTVFWTSGEVALPVIVESASLPKVSLSGLPSGMKFTAKRLLNRDGSVLAEANTVYGTAKKPGTYVVTAKLTNATVKKAVVRRFTVAVDNLTSANDLLFITDADGCEDSLRNGREEMYTIYAGVEKHGLPSSISALDPSDKVTLSGLPSGLKHDAKTGRITGVAKKAGMYTATVKVRSGRETFVSTFTVEVKPLPGWATGTFVGWGECEMDPYPFSEGNVNGTVTVASSGKVSGKILFDTDDERLLTATFSAPALTGYDEGDDAYYCDVDLVFRNGRESVTAQTRRLYLRPSDYDEDGERTVGVIEADDGFFTLWQNVWKVKGFGDLPKFAERKTVVSASLPMYDCPGLAGTSTLTLEIGQNGAVSAMLVDEGEEWGRHFREWGVYKGTLLAVRHGRSPDRYDAVVTLVVEKEELIAVELEMSVSEDGRIYPGGCEITGHSNFAADWCR